VNRIGAIAGRELRSLFVSPLAWTILAGVHFINAWMFLVLVEEFLLLQGRGVGAQGPVGVTDLVAVPMLRVAALVLILVAPLLTMRALAEERRSGTLPLLLTAPVSLSEIVLGKYLAVLTFLLLSVGLTAAMPLSLLAWSELDLGKLGAGILGVSLCAAAFSAAGLFTSSLTSQPGAAAFAAMGLLALTWLLDVGSSGAAGVLRHLSLSAHLDDLLRGVFDSADLVYFACFALAFIALTVKRLDSERGTH
jgi:ABC-2 type transport system permease protein